MGEVIDGWCHLVSLAWNFLGQDLQEKRGHKILDSCVDFFLLGLIMLYMMATETSTYQSTLIQF
jgi:hypothetical protein